MTWSRALRFVRGSSSEDASRDEGAARPSASPSPSPFPGARRRADPTFPRPRGLPEGGPDAWSRACGACFGGGSCGRAGSCCCGAAACGRGSRPARCEVAAEDGGCPSPSQVCGASERPSLETLPVRLQGSDGRGRSGACPGRGRWSHAAAPRRFHGREADAETSALPVSGRQVSVSFFFPRGCVGNVCGVRSPAGAC